MEDSSTKAVQYVAKHGLKCGNKASAYLHSYCSATITLSAKYRNTIMSPDITAVQTHFKNLGFLSFFKKPLKPEKLGF